MTFSLFKGCRLKLAITTYDVAQKIAHLYVNEEEEAHPSYHGVAKRNKTGFKHASNRWASNMYNSQFFE